MKIFFLYLCCFLFSISARAEVVSYQAFGAGMHLMDATVDYTTTPQEYQIRLTTQTRGLLSFLVDSESVFNSRGIWKNKEPKVIESYMETINGDRIKRRNLTFDDKKNQLDYPSVFLDRLLDNSPQTKDYIVFDGKRTLKITFQYEGIVSGSEIGYSDDLKLQYYTVTVDILAGKKKGWFFNRMKDKSSPPLHLYFNETRYAKNRKLVYAAFDTALFGQITIQEVNNATVD